MVKNISVLLTLFILLPIAVKSQEVILSQEKVARLVTEKSSQAKELNLKYQLQFLAPIQTYSIYDWKLNIEGGSETDRTESLSTSISSPNTQFLFDRMIFSTSLSKQFSTTGTMFSLGISRTSQKAETVTLGSSTAYPALTADALSLTLEQPLWANIFGLADRASLRSADYSFKSNHILRLDELQGLVLNSIRIYWKTFVAQEKLKQDIASRENYKKLVQSLQRKKSLGYTNPGELELAEAEYESREQSVKISSNDYLQSVEELILLLDLNPGTEIKFAPVTNLSPPPSLKKVEYEKLRSISSQKYKTMAAEESMTASKSKSYPTVNLVGKYTSSTVDEDSGISQSSMMSGKNPKFYVGLKFTYNFGSNFLKEDALNKKSAYELEKSIEDRKLKETQDKYEQAQRKMLASYSLAISKQRQIDLRQKAVNELRKTFNQGRTDISTLINAMNAFYATETDYTKAVGDYHIAVNELAALSDELVVQSSNDGE